jgi:hypothetical protein
MKTPLTAAAVALTCAVALSGCGDKGSMLAALTPAVLSPQTISTMQTWCSRGAPLIAMAEGQSVIPAAAEIAAVIAPFCRSLTAGQVPPTVDANSADWLARNVVGLSQRLGLTLR